MAFVYLEKVDDRSFYYNKLDLVEVSLPIPVGVPRVAGLLAPVDCGYPLGAVVRR